MPSPVAEPAAPRPRALRLLAVVVIAAGAVLLAQRCTDPQPHARSANATGSDASPATTVAIADLPLHREAPTAAAADADAAAKPSRPSLRFTLVLEARDAWGLLRSAHEVGFGPADGPAFPFLVGSSGEAVHAHTPTHDWVIDDGHLRRVRATSGQVLRVGMAERPRQPDVTGESLAPNRWGAMSSPSLSPLAGTQFLEREEWGELRLLGFSMAPDPANDEPGFHLRGQVFTADGAEAEDASVQVLDPTAENVVRERTSRFETRRIRPGTYTVIAGSRRGGRAQTTVHLRADTSIELVLQEGPALRGRVTDRVGAPVAQARLLWSTASGEYRNHVLTAEDGTFVIPDVSGDVGSLWACVPGDATQLPATGCTASPRHLIELVLDHERCLGSLRVRVAVPAGVSPQQVGVRLWQQGSGIGVRLVPTASTKTVAAFGRDHIPADHYRLELYCPAFGVVDAGTHWLDGTSRVVLDHLALPEPAHVTFALPPGEPTPAADAFELVRVGVAVDCRLLTGRPFAGPHLLGPGRYAIWWRDGTGTVRSHPFSVVTAGTLAVDLPR